MEAEAIAARRRGDPESMAISLCVSAMEDLTAEQTVRVLQYIGGRYLERLKMARQELDAKIKIIEQHARAGACELCRSLAIAEYTTEKDEHGEAENQSQV